MKRRWDLAQTGLSSRQPDAARDGQPDAKVQAKHCDGTEGIIEDAHR
jgi:hypothetical protein